MSMEGLTVRHAKRHVIALPCELSVAPAHQKLVQFSPQSGSARGVISATLVDASAGGVGASSPLFVPRMTLVLVRALLPSDRDTPIFEAVMRLQRVVMTDRTPTYLLGLAFEHHDVASVEHAQRFLARLEAGDHA